MKWLAGLLLLLYPVLVVLGVQHTAPRMVGLVVVAVYLLHALRRCRRFWHYGLSLSLAAALTALLWWADSALLLQLLPSGISLAMAGLFAWGLVSPPSLPGRMAALEHGVDYADLDPRIQAYTRNVTLIWVVFLLTNAALVAVLALLASRLWWAFYTGVLAYLAMGSLFALEYAYRRWVFFKKHDL